jgi:hypothetical protein
MTANTSAFVLGFFHGRKTGLYASNREVQAKYVHFNTEQVECYQNGRDDGVRGDSWRYDQMRALAAA